MQTSLTKNYVPPLTGLRFIAAFMVFAHHFTPQWLPWRVYDVIQEFHIGVTIFFVLSGFLICLRYYDSFKLNKEWFKGYLLNRIARIYPMYFIITTCTFLYLHFIVTHQSWKLYLLNIFFLRGFFNDYLFTGIHQGWSLTVEECFYFAAPLIFFLSKRMWLFLQPILLIFAGIALTVFFNDINYHGFFGSYRFTMVYTFFGRSFEFFLGIQLALLIRKQSSLLKKKIPFTYVGIVGIVMMTIILSLIKGHERYGLFTTGGMLLNNFVLPFFVCSLINGLINEPTVVSRFLSTGVMDLLGKASYTFYLIHLGIYHFILEKYVTQYELIELLITMTVSCLLFKFVEEPLNKLIRRTYFGGLLKPKTVIEPSTN